MKQILILLVLFLPQLLSAQKPPIKWKEIAIEDLQMTSYSLDTSASAVVLCDYGQYYFDLNPNGQNLFLFNKRHLRIKILNKNGLKYAKIRIPFIDMTCEKLPAENSIVVKGITYNLSKKGEVEATRFKKKNIKYIDSTNCMQIAELELANVKVGSIVDFYYEKPTFDIIEPQSWYFQREIPVRHSELRMQAPRYFQYLFSPVNFENYDIAEETNYTRTLLFTPKTRYYRYNRNYHFDLSGKQLQFVKKNNEAIKYQGFIYSPERHIQKLNIHLIRAINENFGYAWQYITHRLFTTTVEGYENYEPIQKSSIIYPAGYILYNLHDWEKVNQQLLKSDRFGLPLIKHWEYQPHLNNMIEGKTTDFEKMEAIYDYVRKNIKWNGEYDIYVRSVFNPGLSKIYTRITKKLIKEKSLKRPFEAKEGTSSEINFILISLLNKAKIEAHPVLISTRDNDQVDANIPVPKQFNHVLAIAKVGEEEFLLDATDSLRPFQLIGKNHITNSAFLVNGKDFGWIETKDIDETSTSIAENVVIDENLNIQRRYIVKYNGYNAIDLRRKIKQEGKESVYKQIKGFADLNNNKSIENIDNEQLPLTFKSITNAHFEGDELRLKPQFTTKYAQKDFTEFIRMYPVEFEYPYKKSYKLEINLPEGYDCQLPENAKFSTFGNQAFYTYKSNKENRIIKLSITLEIKLLSYPNTEYSNIERLFTEINEKLNEDIVIKRISND